MAELKARQKVEERKRDNHRKIIVGAAVMAHIRIDARFRKAVQDALNKAVPDPKHRAVIPDLLDERAYLQAMKAAAKKEAAEAKEAKEAAKAANEPAPPNPPAEAPQQGKDGPEGPATA
jgi:hypothetical protein